MIAKEFWSLEHLSFFTTYAQVSDLLKKSVKVSFSSAFFYCKYFIYLSYVSGFLGFRDFRVEKDLVKKLRKKWKFKISGIFFGIFQCMYAKYVSGFSGIFRDLWMRVCKISFGIFRDISETFEKFVNALYVSRFFRDFFGIPRIFHPDPRDFGISGFLK